MPSQPREVTSARQPCAACLSPHIDLHRGGPTFAWAYKRVVEETDADLFVIFGTAHNPMRNLFSVTRKHFDTPLGTVETDKIVPPTSRRTSRLPGGREINLAADELHIARSIRSNFRPYSSVSPRREAAVQDRASPRRFVA